MPDVVILSWFLFVECFIFKYLLDISECKVVFKCGLVILLGNTIDVQICSLLPLDVLTM